MSRYNAFSSFVERMAFKHATIRNINTDSIDITVEGVDWDGVDWKYNCQGGYEPPNPQIPYSVGDTVSIEWDTFLEEPHAVIGFPDGANQCSVFGLLIYTSHSAPYYKVWKLEAWVNDNPIKVSYWEEGLPGTIGAPIDGGPRNYRLIQNDVAHAYEDLDSYPGITGKILDIQFAENYPYRIVVLVDREVSLYAEEDDVMEYTHVVLTYTINPNTLEMEWEDYWGLQAGRQTGCRGGCSDSDLERNNPWCPSWTCGCGNDESRSGCLACSTSYYYEYTAYDAHTNTEYHYVDDMQSECSGSCGDTCCGDCIQTYMPQFVYIDSDGDPTIFATGIRVSHVMVMPGASRSRTWTWDHPVSQTWLDTGVVFYGGVNKTMNEHWAYNITQEDRCYKAEEKYSYDISGSYYPSGNPIGPSNYDSGFGSAQYGIGNCFNALGKQIMSNIVRGDPSVWRCSYQHNLLGDYYKQLPYIELNVWAGVASAINGDRQCLAPLGTLCGQKSAWTSSYSLYLVLSDDAYYYSQYERYSHADYSYEDDPENNEYKGHLVSIPTLSIDNASPRWALRQARPDVAVVWGDTALLHTIFKSFTTTFIGSLQEVRCKEGQTNPDCYNAVTQALIDEGHTYSASEIGEEREWTLLIGPDRAGWIISFRKDGTYDIEFELYAFTDLEEDIAASGIIIHSGSPSFTKSYESSYFEPKGHAVCVYTP